MREINDAGLTLVKRWEGILDGDPTTVNLDPYLDPVGIWTIGWGHAITDPATGRFLRGTAGGVRARELYPDGLTMAQAETLLRADLLDSARDVAAMLRVPVTDNQFSALVSFHFNTGALRGSTLLRKINAHEDGADEQFPRWNKGRVNGQLVVLNGLTKRRADERALFLQE